MTARLGIQVWFMVFNATYIVDVSLLVEEIGVPRENPRYATSLWQTLSHNVVSSTPHHKQDLTSQH